MPPTWPYGTRRKAGTPDTFNIGGAVIDTMISPVSIAWLQPITALIPLIDPITVNTDALCAEPPPSSETWGFSDVINGLTPSGHTMETDKLVRMAKAASWPTYCEFSPPPAGLLPEGLPTHLNPGFFSSGLHIGPQDDKIEFHTVDSLNGMTVDLWTVLSICHVVSDAGTPPVLTAYTAHAPDGWPNLHTCPNTAGAYKLSELIPDSSMPPIGGGAAIPWTPTDGYWIVRTYDNTGQWDMYVQAWKLTVPTPPDGPWPFAPAVPQPYQFSDACAADLCAMAAAFPTLTVGVANIGFDVTAIKTDADDLMALLVNYTDVLYGSPASAGPGAQVVDLPAYVRGVVITITPSPYMTQVNTSPPGLWGAGWLIEGGDYGWKPAVRIKHSPQLLHPTDRMSNKLQVDVPTGTHWTYQFVVPGP